MRTGFSQQDREAYSIIHMTDTQPFRLPEEKRYFVNSPISVEKASPDQKLDRMSRLNFNKIYTVEHNVVVMAVGKVTRESMPALVSYWKTSFKESNIFYNLSYL